jgi:hypothetical protein
MAMLMIMLMLLLVLSLTLRNELTKGRSLPSVDDLGEETKRHAHINPHKSTHARPPLGVSSSSSLVPTRLLFEATVLRFLDRSERGGLYKWEK